MKLKKISLFLLAAFLFVGCKEEEITAGVMELNNDGTTYTITTFDNTLISQTHYEEIGKRLEVRVDLDKGKFILAVYNWEWQNAVEGGVLKKSYRTNADGVALNAGCKEINGSNYCDGALASYSLFSNGKNYFSEKMEDEGEGQIVITKIDPDKQLVSGAFDVVLADFFEGNKKSFKGIFTNLPYRVQ